MALCLANEGLSDGNIMLIASKDMPSAARTNRNGAPPKEGFLTFELDVESYLSTSIPEGTSLELEGVTSTGQRILLSNVDVAGIKKGWDGRIKREISMPEDIYSIVLRLKTSSANPVLLRMDNFCLYSTVGINDIQNEINFSIYPNPTTGQLTIQFSSSVEQDISLKVLDILGRQVNNGLIQKGSSNYNFSIDNLAGIYIIQLTDSDGNMSQRKVIKME
ncbi:MAG: T9SS type A sorting domain-containing protein [Saprospiraceae bacterium]|nr:T9SS type A sorting domain-containing protein [Saprospiraceae bacterium]